MGTTGHLVPDITSSVALEVDKGKLLTARWADLQIKSKGKEMT